MFTPWCVAMMVCLMGMAATLFWLELPTIQNRLPTFGTFFSAQNIVWLAVALAACKVLHELGHAFTCRHFGGNCRELGVMLLVFTPCLYCNVSDAWMISNKWQRIAVDAAGIYIELILASASLLLWWSSEPGAFNAFCLNIVFVCSVGTVLFNGNPLLRYDGYFILADWCELPNLAQRGGQYVRDGIVRWCTGVESDAVPPAVGERTLLVAYTIASWAYRLLIMTAIFWICQLALKPFGLQWLAVLIVFIAIIGMAAGPVKELSALMADPTRRRKIRPSRLLTVCLLTAALGVVLVVVPMPRRIFAPAVLESRDADVVYVTAPGVLVEAVREGTSIEQGAMIARLDNVALKKDVARLESELAARKSLVDVLTKRRSPDASGDAFGSSGELPAAIEAVSDLENRLQDRVAEYDRLTLKAPKSGTVLPPRTSLEKPAPGELSSWSGTPLAPRNHGAVMKAGTEICTVGDPKELTAQLVVDESVIGLIREGQSVRIQVDELPGAFLKGTVAEIARRDSDQPLPELVAKNLVPLQTERGGGATLTVTSYQVRVELAPHDAPVPLRASGNAAISVAAQPIAARVYEFLRRTFRIEW